MKKSLKTLMTMTILGGAILTASAPAYAAGDYFHLHGVVEGQTTGNSVTLYAMTQNGAIIEAPSTANMEGHGHFHYYVDGKYVANGVEPWYNFKDLTDGDHTLAIEFMNNDHSSYMPKQWKETKVHVDSAWYYTLGAKDHVDNASSNVTLSAFVGNNAWIEAPSTTNAAGHGHFHYYVDGKYVANGIDTNYTFTGLSAGKHTLSYEFMNNDHSSYNTKQMQSVDVNVTAPNYLNFWMNVSGYEHNGMMPNLTVAPFLWNDRTYVPFRDIATELGGTVGYDDTYAWMTLNGHELKLKFNSTDAWVDGKWMQLDTSIVVQNDRTHVPLRFLGESLGYWVGWNAEKGAVMLSK